MVISLSVIAAISMVVVITLSIFFHELGHIVFSKLYGFNWEWTKFNQVKVFGTKNYDPSKQAFIIGIAGGVFETHISVE